MYYYYNICNSQRIEKTYGTLLDENGVNIMKIGSNGWIILDENPSTGYSWKLIKDNSGTYKVIKKFYLPTNTGKVGAPGKAVWIIKAVDTGMGTITLRYSRAYSMEASDKEVTYEINVI
ncbi:protease inhibitor I42 family protein [Clostridium hydrogenum]|uniref:protease inhibitor I42 family protein n=1 Tax=Clostridium hydrogenum TaxID=2855764 RepID=UPI001F332850|nr:protease inhibitor I42 family protein [Clostridium hydrogenum]